MRRDESNVISEGRHFIFIYLRLNLFSEARAAFTMIKRAEERGQIEPGDTLIEATSGNTGIALAAAAAALGYRMVIVMSDAATYAFLNLCMYV